MIRTKGEAGTGDVVEAVRHIRTLHKERGLKGTHYAELNCVLRFGVGCREICKTYI